VATGCNTLVSVRNVILKSQKYFLGVLYSENTGGITMTFTLVCNYIIIHNTEVKEITDGSTK